MAEEKKPPAAHPTPANGEKEKTTGKVKRPSALKRALQNEKRRLKNRSLNSTVSTAVRSFKEAVSKNESKEQVQSKLQSAYSIVDKAVKRGLYKPQKAARIKSRLALRVGSK